MTAIKQLIIWVLVVTIGCSVCYADGVQQKDAFTLHNGTVFGMTSDEVRSIETGNGITLTDLNSRWDEEGITSFFTQPRISLAGRDEGEVSYVFSNDELVYVSYWFNTDGMDSTAIANDYTELLTAYITKYGMPDFEMTEGTSSKLPRTKYCQTTQVLALSDTSENYQPINYCQWQIDFDDGSGVLIELYLYAYSSSYSSFVSEGVSYTWFDASEYISVAADEAARQAQMNSDI